MSPPTMDSRPESPGRPQARTGGGGPLCGASAAAWLTRPRARGVFGPDNSGVPTEYAWLRGARPNHRFRNRVTNVSGNTDMNISTTRCSLALTSRDARRPVLEPCVRGRMARVPTALSARLRIEARSSRRAPDQDARFVGLHSQLARERAVGVGPPTCRRWLRWRCVTPVTTLRMSPNMDSCPPRMRSSSNGPTAMQQSSSLRTARSQSRCFIESNPPAGPGSSDSRDGTVPGKGSRCG